MRRLIERTIDVWERPPCAAGVPAIRARRRLAPTIEDRHGAAFPDLRMDAEDVLACGEKAVARVRTRAPTAAVLGGRSRVVTVEEDATPPGHEAI